MWQVQTPYEWSTWNIKLVHACAPLSKLNYLRKDRSGRVLIAQYIQAWEWDEFNLSEVFFVHSLFYFMVKVLWLRASSRSIFFLFSQMPVLSYNLKEEQTQTMWIYKTKANCQWLVLYTRPKNIRDIAKHAMLSAVLGKLEVLFQASISQGIFFRFNIYRVLGKLQIVSSLAYVRVWNQKLSRGLWMWHTVPV